MKEKTILLVDDEQGFLEPLADALIYEGCRVLRAFTVEDALKILSSDKIDLVTIDIMIDPGPTLKNRLRSQTAGLYLCEEIFKRYPHIHAFSISVVNDIDTIRKIESYGVRFLRKGETPLQTVLNMFRSKLTGVAFSSERTKYYKSERSK